MSVENSCLDPVLNSTVLLDRMMDGFIALDSDFQFIYVNREAERIFMKPAKELINRSIWEMHPGIIGTTIYSELKNCLASNLPVHFEHHGLRTGKWFEVKAFPSGNGLSAFFIDITDKKLMEKELFKLEALNIIGEISASISHEIRNPLTAIKGFLQLLQEKDTNHKEYFDLMIGEADRANSIITEFLSLAGNKTSLVDSRNINVILQSMAPLIKADALSTGNEVEFILGDIPNFLLNENEIRQLILNLVRNGLDAMNSGGKLTIETYSQANEITLAIKDQGTGISPEIIDKVWVPFFTTKEKGTGLGLAVCYKIVNRHQGRIEIITSTAGTTFLVKFKN